MTTQLSATGFAASKTTALKSIGDCLEARAGVGPNFNLLRLLAAFSVLISHAFGVPVGDESREPLFILSGGHHTAGRIAVAVFFAMSGFLVTPSLVRSRVISRFAARRLVRLLPALLVVLLVLTFLAGPVMSTLPVQAYFSDVNTYRFPIEVLRKSGTGLPGVFMTAPVTGVVDSSLWSLKYEFASYIVLAIFGATGLLGRPRILACCAVFIICTAYALYFLNSVSGSFYLVKEFLQWFEFFISGVCIAIWRDKILISKILIAVAFFICAGSAIFGGFYLLAPFPLSYIVIAAGVLPQPFRGRFSPKGDYSYGLYLWAFPVQQLVQTTFGGGTVLNIAISAPVTLGIAYFSWTYLEKPALKLTHPKTSTK